MSIDSALDRVMGLRVGNGNTKRRRSKLGATALVAHQEYNTCCLEFQVPCRSDSVNCFQCGYLGDMNQSKKQRSVDYQHHQSATMVLSVSGIRQIASDYGYEEIELNTTSRVISFRRQTTRINVYYTTGTVGTCLNHPSKGKTQLFRRNVTGLDTLERCVGT